MSSGKAKCSRPLLHVLCARADGVVRRGEVALVEGTNLVLRERADDGVQNAAIMEQNEVLLAPAYRHHAAIELTNANATECVHNGDSPIMRVDELRSPAHKHTST